MYSSSIITNLQLLSFFISSLHVYAIPLSESLLPRALTCDDKASDGTTYNTASHSYEIHCATDYYGGDLSSTNTATFGDCLSACDAASSCIAVAYVSGSCYLKSQLNQAYPNDAVWGAKRTDASATLSCVNNKSNGTTYQASGQSYTILCGYDNYGDDLSSVAAGSLEQCIAACDAASGCIDVSYSGGTCYLKNKLTTWTKNRNVDTAVLTSAEQGTGNSGSGPTCANNQNDQQQYTTSTGAVFDILCAVDYYGGDLTSLDTATFGACIEACAGNAQCIDVSYLGTTCYLKDTLKTAIYGSSVWTAKLHSAKIVSSSSTTSSVTTMTVASTVSTTSSTLTTVVVSSTTAGSSSLVTSTTASTSSTATTPSTTTSSSTTTASPTTTTSSSTIASSTTQTITDSSTTPSTTTTTVTPSTTPAPTTLATTTTTTASAPTISVFSGWTWAANNNQGALSGSFACGSKGYNGNCYAALNEGVYGDTGTRSMCVSATAYIESSGTYTLNFRVGRISYPQPGYSYSTDSITWSVKFDNALIGSNGNVCGSYSNTCPLQAADGVNRWQSVSTNVVVGTAQTGYKTVGICGIYTTPRRGTEDAFLVDYGAVTMVGPN